MRQVAVRRTFAAGIICLLLLVCLSRSCDPEEPLRRAIVFGDTQTVRKLLSSNASLANKSFRFANETPLFCAVTCANSKETIDLLVASGADINMKSGGFNLTPLQQAVWSGKTEAVKALLAHKPDVNAVNSDNQTALSYGITVYMNSVFSNNTNNDGEKIIDLLLANGADIDHGYPILMDASHYGNNARLMEFLLSKGANVNVQDSDGSTPLTFAIATGNKEAVGIILEYHPDLKLKEGYSSPLAVAVDRGNLDIALMVQKYVLQSRSNIIGLAAVEGNVEELRSLLQKTPQSIEEKDQLGLTPLS